MQKGYETLIDTRRRAYDSTLEFDESVPGSEEGSTEETFFTVYGPVFKRNERFSNIQPIPQLGDMSTPIEDVDTFYDFWCDFKTWREPPNEDDEATEETDDRHRKRELEREAAKAR
jgi:DnaJ family protein C protein 2